MLKICPKFVPFLTFPTSQTENHLQDAQVKSLRSPNQASLTLTHSSPYIRPSRSAAIT